MPASSRLVHVLVLDLPAATGVRLGRGAPSHLHGAHGRCPNRQARDKGNPGAPHVQFEARVPGKASKPLCILASVTHWRKDAFRNEQNRAVGITRVRTYFCKGCKRNVRSTTADLRGKPQKHKWDWSARLQEAARATIWKPSPSLGQQVAWHPKTSNQAKRQRSRAWVRNQEAGTEIGPGCKPKITKRAFSNSPTPHVLTSQKTRSYAPQK